MNNNPKIEIPSLTLSEYGEYIFTYNFTNFLGKEFSADYNLMTTTYESPYVSIDDKSPHVYFTNNRITLTGTILH